MLLTGSDRADERLQFAFGLLGFVVALWLLASLSHQTSWIDGLPLLRQPALVSALALAAMAAFSGLVLAAIWIRQIWRFRAGWPLSPLLSEGIAWIRALEYVVWFMGYVWLVPVTGYLPTTVAFCVLLTLRVGYRSARFMMAAVGTGLAIVLVFKTMLSVKIPGGTVYEFLPATLRNFAVLYL